MTKNNLNTPKEDNHFTSELIRSFSKKPYKNKQNLSKNPKTKKENTSISSFFKKIFNFKPKSNSINLKEDATIKIKHESQKKTTWLKKPSWVTSLLSRFKKQDRPKIMITFEDYKNILSAVKHLKKREKWAPIMKKKALLKVLENTSLKSYPDYFVKDILTHNKIDKSKVYIVEHKSKATLLK